ncbi:hypothetical protein [Aquimarina longa]|uniref:hypothetical protein n=2 Tax=Aquimarina longa TaxID=1080221 RepID=UPI000784ED80|nr:hypothetical protein [Aquimarina longa]
MKNKKNPRNIEKIHSSNAVTVKTRKALLTENIRVENDNSCKKYNRKIIRISENYNFLEYYLIVRMYMQHKHNIDNRLLEILFFLYPKKLFSWYDFKEYPLTFSYRRIDTLIKKEMVEVFRPDTARSRQIYRLTQKAQTIVRHFYQYLSGEKKIPTNRQNNPLMAKQPKTTREQMIQEMIIKMANSKEHRF